MTVAYSASSVTVSDGESIADFIVKRSGTSADMATASTISYATEDVSAKAGADYTATSGSLNFAAGVTEATISVEINSNAYEDITATKTFLLELTGYSSVTGSISPTSNSSTKQTYLYIPDDDDTAAVPTSDAPGDDLKNQAVYSGLSTPASTTVSMPVAYMRLGYARSDMNEYERVAVNSDTYHPVWLQHDGDTPVEQGTMQNFALPRGIDRRDKTTSQVKSEEVDNAHLDGMFLFSNANYNLTVGKNHTTVVKGSLALDVGGIGRFSYQDDLSEWVVEKDTQRFLTAKGVTRINGQGAAYEIARSREFNVLADLQVNYRYGAKYNLNSQAELTINNAASYEVANSIGLKVTGYNVSAECDVFGNFDCKYIPGKVFSTHTSMHQVASESICMSIQTGPSKVWTEAVARAANVNALAAIGISSGAAAQTFRKNGEFYKTATPDNLDTTYASAFSTILPDSCAGLAAVTSAIVAGACIAQKIAEELPSSMPKIEMNTNELELSVGDTSLKLTEGGIEMNGLDVVVAADQFGLATLTKSSIESPVLILDAENVAANGNVDVSENLTVLANASVFGTLTSALIQSP